MTWNINGSHCSPHHCFLLIINFSLGRLRSDIRKNSSGKGLCNIGMGSLGKWWHHYPWNAKKKVDVALEDTVVVVVDDLKYRNKHGTKELLRLEKISKIIKSGPQPAPPCLINSVLKSHIHSYFEQFQGWGIQFSPVQPLPSLDHPFHEELSPDIQSKLLLDDVVTWGLHENTAPNLTNRCENLRSGLKSYSSKKE